MRPSSASRFLKNRLFQQNRPVPASHLLECASRRRGPKGVSKLIGSNRFNQLPPRDFRHNGVPCEIVIEVHFLLWI